MRERFTRRCAAHLTALFERAEGYRITDEDSQSRESGLWCPTHLPNSLSGHWVTRWVVWDNGTPESPSQGQIARASVDDPVNGSAVELDEVFFKGMLQLLDEGSSVFERLDTIDEQPQRQPPQPPPHVFLHGSIQLRFNLEPTVLSFSVSSR